MILVTVGTHPQPFTRLIDAVAKAVDDENLKVIAQVGTASAGEYPFETFDYAPQEKLTQLMKASEMVITHGGPGSAIAALRLGKPTIVVPRRHQFGEHVDDHQVDFARFLNRKFGVATVLDVSTIGQEISNVSQRPPVKFDFDPEVGRTRISQVVSDLLAAV